MHVCLYTTIMPQYRKRKRDGTRVPYKAKMRRRMCRCGKKRPSFNQPGETKAVCCADCKDDGMIDVINKKCRCGKKRPTFNQPGKTTAVCCADCKDDGMVNVKDKTCRCGKKQPIFNKPGETNAVCCADCKDEGMVDIKHKPCRCGKKQPTFNKSGETKAVCCADCKDEGMVDIKHKPCRCGKKIPTFNQPGEPKAVCCAECKDDGMVNVKDKTCRCGKKIPSFNKPGETKAVCCADCKDEGMVNVKDKICRCGTHAWYGLPGHQPTYCAQHKHEVEGMLPYPRRRCRGTHIHNGRRCVYFSTHGSRSGHAEYCDIHAPAGFVTLTNYKCQKCGSYDILSAKRLCCVCDPAMFKAFRLAKQRQVKQWFDLSEEHNDYTTYDTRLPHALADSDCEGFNRRPDFLFDCKTHLVVVSVDEYEHDGYCKHDEIKRMADIAQAFGMPTTFIRYNPDEFYLVTRDMNDPRFNLKRNKKKDPTDNQRRKVLFEMLSVAKQNPGTLYDATFLQVVYLFYSGDHPQKNRTLNPIVLRDHM